MDKNNDRRNETDDTEDMDEAKMGLLKGPESEPETEDVDEQPSSEFGQGLAEYALVLSLIAIVAIGALIFLGGAITDILSQVATAI